MEFFFNISIKNDYSSDFVLEDYIYWFNSNDKVNLIVFYSSENDRKQLFYLIEKYTKIKSQKSPKIKFLKQIVDEKELYKYYTKSILINEIINYKKGELFRIFKLLNPIAYQNSFENQAISIQYDPIYDKYSKNPSYKNQLDTVKDYLHNIKCERILDIGCGCGANYYLIKEGLKKNNINYYGIDISRYQLIKAIDRFERDEKTQFYLGNILDIKYDDNFFDISFSESVLAFVQDIPKALYEMNRVSKFGFFASLYTHNKTVSLDTGAVWKYYDKITPNIYHLHSNQKIKKILDTMKNIIYIENDLDQYFDALKIRTKNIFIYPKKWYLERKEKFNSWNYQPLMN